MTTITEIHPWPPAARHIITGISKADRDEYDEDRCSPVFRIGGEWAWCNEGYGPEGHIQSGNSISESGPIVSSGPFCAWCGNRLHRGYTPEGVPSLMPN